MLCCNCLVSSQGTREDTVSLAPELMFGQGREEEMKQNALSPHSCHFQVNDLGHVHCRDQRSHPEDVLCAPRQPCSTGRVLW